MNTRITNKGGEEGATVLDAATAASSAAGVLYELIVPEPSVTFSAITSNWDGATATGKEFTKPMGGVFRNLTVSAGRCVCYKRKP